MYYQTKRWSNAKKSTHNGFHYDSGFEASKAQELDLMIKARAIKSYQRQVPIDLIITGWGGKNKYNVGKYFIDFVVIHNDDTREYIECKGIHFPVGILKFKILEALYTDDPMTKAVVMEEQGKYKIRKIKKVR